MTATTTDAADFDFSAWDGITRVAVTLLEAEHGMKGPLGSHGAMVPFDCTEAAVPVGYLAGAVAELCARAYKYGHQVGRVAVEVYDGDGRTDREMGMGDLYRMVALYDTVEYPYVNPGGNAGTAPLAGLMALAGYYTRAGLLWEAGLR